MQRLIKYIKPALPFLLGLAVLLSSSQFFQLSLANGLAQLLLFALVVCIPTWKTGRMSYVDIGWPLGVALIGLLTWFYSDGYWLRSAIVSAVYLFIGLRMGVAALALLRHGHLDKELPRYQYQRRRWQKANISNTAAMMQIEALVQGLANASFLALPALIIASNPATSFSVFEVIGLALWLAAFVMESVADYQKKAFLTKMRQQGMRHQVCSVGLWRFSRHPNYFAEWMVWNGLVIAALPSWLALYSTADSLLLWVLLGAGLLFTSKIMYTTLVYYSGAVPAEYYSVQKRPGYLAYQQQTNRFFPGPVKSQ
ncbi:DUF1295 domain-containing protein [Ferrimonas senticii]|uniref:DUF1295 domain-containing protein n=1 Tax=Ferrimonas senticii TaxID=394566 RepID=UPI000422B3CC|nr:DUF1295 domain-containing protein [Ferrimonas senticii]